MGPHIYLISLTMHINLSHHTRNETWGRSKQHRNASKDAKKNQIEGGGGRRKEGNLPAFSLPSHADVPTSGLVLQGTAAVGEMALDGAQETRARESKESL